MPLRTRLYRLADDQHVFVLVLHHIAADGWSLAPLAADLSLAYSSRCAGQIPSWEPLPIQYIDFALWQRAYLGDPQDPDSMIAADLRYWEKTLAGMPRLSSCRRPNPAPLPTTIAVTRSQCSGRPHCTARSRKWPESTAPPTSWSSRRA
ncbi:condensation domain protein [Mycobacterium kansasii 824]|nr:condensation domain protein [Mycobacterium kansasii 824]